MFIKYWMCCHVGGINSPPNENMFYKPESSCGHWNAERKISQVWRQGQSYFPWLCLVLNPGKAKPLWRFIMFSVVVERCLPWAPRQFFLCNDSVKRSQALPLGGSWYVTRASGYWVNVLGILLQSCSRDIQLHRWKRKSPFLRQDKLLWNECSQESEWLTVCWGSVVPPENICISDMSSWQQSWNNLKVFWISWWSFDHSEPLPRQCNAWWGSGLLCLCVELGGFRVYDEGCIILRNGRIGKLNQPGSKQHNELEIASKIWNSMIWIPVWFGLNSYK